MTVSDLRKLLEGLPDNTPVRHTELGFDRPLPADFGPEPHEFKFINGVFLIPAIEQEYPD